MMYSADAQSHSSNTSLRAALVDTNDHSVVSLERLQRQLLLGLDTLLPQLDHFSREDLLGRGGRIDTVGLDGDDDTTTDLEELMCVQSNNTGLVWLGNVGENAVDHAHDRTVGSHVDQVTSTPVGEFDRENRTGGTDNVCN